MGIYIDVLYILNIVNYFFLSYIKRDNVVKMSLSSKSMIYSFTTYYKGTQT